MAKLKPEGLAIEVKGLGKAFGRALVLHDLDLEVPWGQVLTILGPNGVGKTTLIKILATLTKPDAGMVRVAGLRATDSGQVIRRVVGVLTHDNLLYDALTCYENLKFVARMYGLDRIDERIEGVAARMGLSARLHQRAGILSHGMRKRLSIARVILHDPAILLMDEPENGLDPEALEMLEEVISSSVASYRTVLMTTHNLERGLALGQRMVIMARGRIAHQESLDALGLDAVKNAYLRHTEEVL